MIQLNFPRLRRALSQPDWILATLCILFLAMGDMILLPLWVFIIVFAIQAIITHCTEYQRLSSIQKFNRGRSVISWSSGVVLWGLAITLMGGLSSPLFYLVLFSVLHNLRNRRKQRYFIISILLMCSLLGPWLLDHFFAGELIPNVISPTSRIIVFFIAVITIMCHSLFFAEYRPLEQDFLSSMGTYWAGSMNQDSFYRSVLARFMRLYKAEWGTVAIAIPLEKRKRKFQVLYYAGSKVDDPKIGAEVFLDENHVRFVYEGKDIKARRFWKSRNEEGIPGQFLSAFSFALRRFHTREAMAIFTVYSQKHHFLSLTASSYYLDIYHAEAETVCTLFTYISSYRKLLLAKDHETFSSKLTKTCNEMIPPSAGPVKVALSLSSTRPTLSHAIVPVTLPMEEGRKHPRWISAIAKIHKPDMSSINTVYNYLKDAASATILTQRVSTAEALEASEKVVIGLSNLEPPDKDFTQKIREWDRNDSNYYKNFQNCGFRLLWANQLMHTWNPSISQDKIDSRIKYRKFCYKYFNSEKQDKPCWGCPCLLLYKKFLDAKNETERDRILSLVEVGPSHSPAGRMNIYRHFELGAYLIRNSLLPENPEIDDRISFIRETVVDRTLEVEVLFIISKTAAELEKFISNLNIVKTQNPEEQKEVFDGMFNIVAEGLGRSFQANHVVKINLGYDDGAGKIEADYVCAAAHVSDVQQRKLADSERRVIENSREGNFSNKISAIQEYFTKRDMLFLLDSASNGIKLSDELTTQLRDYLSTENSSYKVREILRNNNSDFFKDYFPQDHRCLIIPVPPTQSILMVLTSEPEDWERSSPSGELLPRYPEMELCECVGEMLGHLLESLKATNNYATRLINKKVRDLMHEMDKIFSNMPLDVDQIHRLVRMGIKNLISISELIKQYDLMGLAKQWHHLLEQYYRRPRSLSLEITEKLSDNYILKTCNNFETKDGINYGLFEELAKSGISPDNLNDIEKLRKVPQEDRSKFLSFAANLISTYTAIMHINDAEDFVSHVYESVLGRSQIIKVHVFASIERIIRLVGRKLPNYYVNVKVQKDLVVIIDKPAFYIIVKNLLSNAIEATLKKDCTIKQVQILAYIYENSLVVEVSNPPPLITSDIKKLCKYGITTKEGEGYGIGLYLAQEAAERNGTEIEYEVKDGFNCFKASFPNVEI